MVGCWAALPWLAAQKELSKLSWMSPMRDEKGYDFLMRKVS